MGFSQDSLDVLFGKEIEDIIRHETIVRLRWFVDRRTAFCKDYLGAR